MSLKARLSQLQSQAGVTTQARPSASQTAAEPPSLPHRLARLRPQQPDATERVSTAQLALAVDGEVIAEGLIRIGGTLPLEGRLGSTEWRILTEGHSLPGETGARPAVYLDSETTGLAGGSGTLAFLVGVARLQERQIRLTQWLITSFAAEAALLDALEQTIPDGHRLVSYNGKSYDIPLLVTRYRMHGMTPTFTQRAHLDLLHPVRRLFARRWSDCRLTTLEQRLLGFTRHDDLPGSQAPQAWFRYLRSGDARMLVRVVAHNRQDILSLALGHAALAKACAGPHRHRVDLHGLGRWLADTDERQAITLLAAHESDLCADGLRLLAHLHRRNGDWHLALPIWARLADTGCRESIERLAKYHEHISRDLAVALHYCEQLNGTSADRHRAQRIRLKMTAERCVSHPHPGSPGYSMPG